MSVISKGGREGGSVASVPNIVESFASLHADPYKTNEEVEK
jgi:hypothetical protein